jgi:putative aldouronate transport system permease protein
MSTKTAVVQAKNKKSLGQRFVKEMASNYELYIMILPVIAYYIIFCYGPMYGVLMAFQDYKPMLGVAGSPWVGFDHFAAFFNSVNFFRLLKNTLTISVVSLLFGFPAPIILALSINEVKTRWFAKTVQTITYIPHFISMVVVCAIVREFTADTGVVNQLFQVFGYSGKTMLSRSELFVPIYVLSGIWQEVGWGSIIYLAALSGVDRQLYEAAEIDGAGKWKQMIHITLPSILPTIIILFIMRMGTLLSVGYEKVLLLYNAGIYDTADVISTYVYRLGFQNASYSASTAIGLFNSVVNIFLILTTNFISSKVSETSLF